MLSAITLLQPYASAVVHGPKRIENRPKPPPARLTTGGAFWIAVHAGAEFFPRVTREDFTTPREFAPSPCEMDMLDGALREHQFGGPRLPLPCVAGRRRVSAARRAVGGLLARRSRSARRRTALARSA